jgi:hypothetical protein
MLDVTKEWKDETPNHPQRKPKLEPRHHEESDYVTCKVMRRRSSQPEKYEESDSQTGETTTGTGEKQFSAGVSTLGRNLA